MAVAGGAVVVFKRLRQPSILGYLLAGILVGPFTFPNPPVTNIEIVRLLADLGLVLLLFAVGMEFGWRRIRQVGLGVLLIGSIEMLVMVSIGYQLGRLLGWTPVEAIYLGSAMAISSFWRPSPKLKTIGFSSFGTSSPPVLIDPSEIVPSLAGRRVSPAAAELRAGAVPSRKKSRPTL